MIAFPLSAAAAELPAGVQQILQQSELTPDKLVHITLQELLQTLAGWLKNAWGQPLQLARRAVLFLLYDVLRDVYLKVFLSPWISKYSLALVKALADGTYSQCP